MNFPTDNFGGYDAGDTGDFGGYDSADGVTHIPAGVYLATIERGKADKTKTKGEDSYKLCFQITDGPYARFTVWKTLMFGDRQASARSKAVLSPLGLTTVASLRGPFPPIGRTITCKILVSVREWQGQTRNDVERFEVVSNEDTATNPFAVPLPTPFPDTQGKGQTS